MLLSEIIKGVLLENKASSFLRFYREIERGYDPDKAILFDCLMTLKEYYEDYIRWYNKYPKKKQSDIELYPHFEKRLQEIKTALESDDTKKKIIAIDNGINQWHIDFPVVYHLHMGIYPAEADDIWLEVMDLLRKLGKLSDESPYKRINESFWQAQLENFWLSPEGEWKRCGSHQSFAKDMSKIDVVDLAYEWMFQHGWAKVNREGYELFVTMSRFKTNSYKLNKKQKDAVLEKALHDYPEKLEIKGIFDEPLDLYERH